MSAYLHTNSFYGYIISKNFLPKITDFKKSPSSLLKSSIKELVHKSKSTGDTSVFDPQGLRLPLSLFSSVLTDEIKFFAAYSVIANNC